MAAEARAMLDALMGQDRNAALPESGNQDWDSLRKKKSCYDNDICPLYCAWGVDVFELFTNTKSAIGPNPYQVRDDAREEYLSLPEHEKERLGFERMLHRKLGELVRSCDRIVARNKEKLRQEIAKAARARGGTNTIDPVTDVSDEMVAEAAELMADLELREEEVKGMLQDMMEIDTEWKDLWNQLQVLEKETSDVEMKQSDDGPEKNGNDVATINPDDKTTDENQNGNDAATINPDDKTTEENQNGIDAATINPDDKATDENQNGNDTATDENQTKDEHENKPEEDEKDDISEEKATKIKAIKSKLYTLSSEQQKIIAAIAHLTSQTIVPLRDNLQNLTKQLYYVKTDMSADKLVCEMSGNFMSTRDAEERIAAHYAGKQYVGWKMVREKFQELEKKSRNWGRPMGGPPPGQHEGSRGGGYGPPPGQGYGGGRPGGYHDNRGHDQRRERSRERDNHSRWERDRGPPRGGGGDGGHNRRDGHRGWR